jgi:DNA primase large subunit
LKFLKFPFQIATDVSNDLVGKIRFKSKTAKIDESATNENQIIYKIPFENALNLIPTMEYFLYRGYIYVFKSDLNRLIETVFRENVVKRLNLLNKHYDSICSDKRISDIVKRLLLRRESM